MSLSEPTDDVDEPFVNVFHRRPVAIVIDIDVHQRLRILTQTKVGGEQRRLLTKGRMTHFQDGDIDLVEQDLDLFLQRSGKTLSVESIDSDGSLTRISHLELRSETLQHTPKDLGTQIKYLVDGRQRIPANSQTEVLLGSQ
jgi:hypothetical protein